VSKTEITEARESLQRTPLHGLHVEHGARMVPFAHYEMPVSYPLGVLKEHLHTRAASGLFDISHMGQIALWPTSGKLTDAARALERLVPMDILGLEPGRQRYAYFTNENGGILDDLMVANLGDHLLLIVNAARNIADVNHLATHVIDQCRVEPMDRALLALQGPKSEAALAPFAPDCTRMRFMDVRRINILGADCIATRSGYTGEDGFEISVPSDMAREIAEAFLENRDVELIGLGARDSLRLEAGLCLYGSDIDETTTPVEAGLTWAMQQTRRHGGDRGGGFPGATTILQQIADGPARRRVGLRPEGRAPIRNGTLLFAVQDAGEPAGHVTSGGFGPSVDAPIAMGYLPASLAAPRTTVFAEVRGKRLPVSVVKLPFVTPNFKRS
jgi:aminomethyltransferase